MNHEAPDKDNALRSSSPGGEPSTSAATRAPVAEVFLVFLKLGMTSFGGPAAHIGYFRTEFVERRQWLDDSNYSDLVALSQFLPGPASSKVGIALGLGRAGWPGAFAAWLGFTLPSALLLMLFAFGVTQWAELTTSGAIHGLKLAAVAVVAQAVLGMSKSLCPDRTRAFIAVASTLLVLAMPSALGQVIAILVGAVAGWRLLNLEALPVVQHLDYGVNKRTGAVLLLSYVALLVLLPLLAAGTDSLAVQMGAVFYKAGALVFGGGHVVLPLLETGIVGPGWLDHETFLAGYGAAQAVPGPLFTFAAYLGTAMPSPVGSWPGGLLALVAVFLPAFLLTPGSLPFWEALRQRVLVRRALGGVNAAIVGVLGAALYDPVWTSAVRSKADFGIALAAFGALVFGRVSPVWVVAGASLAGWVFSSL